MVADMEVDMVANIVADMVADMAKCVFLEDSSKHCEFIMVSKDLKRFK